MKKIFYTLLLFILFIPIISAKTTVSVTKTEGNKGDTVTVYLNLANNPEFQILGVTLKYDKNVLSYEDGEITALKKAFIKELNKGDGAINLAAVSISSLSDTGNIAKFDFKIKSNEVTSSTIEVEVTDFGADETTPLDYKVNNGLITIKDGKAKEPPKEEPAKTEEKPKQEPTKTEEKPKEEPSKSEPTESESPKEDEPTNNNTYVSSDEEIATVDANGNITYKKEGKVTISTIDKDGKITEEEIEVTKDMVDGKKDNKTAIYIGAGIVGVIAIVAIGALFLKKKNEGKN